MYTRFKAILCFSYTKHGIPIRVFTLDTVVNNSVGRLLEMSFTVSVVIMSNKAESKTHPRQRAIAFDGITV